jgi:hypothetical protein
MVAVPLFFDSRRKSARPVISLQMVELPHLVRLARLVLCFVATTLLWTFPTVITLKESFSQQDSVEKLQHAGGDFTYRIFRCSFPKEYAGLGALDRQQ